MDRFAALETLVAVADEGGFARAARRLGTSPATATRAIATLETRLGVSLFRRTTRALQPTDEGVALITRARDILHRLADAERDAMGGQAEPSGALQVTAPVVFGRLHVLPVVGRLMADHPRLSVRLMLIDRPVRLVEEGIDVAVRIGEPRDSSLRMTPLGTVGRVVVASPTYLARRGRPVHPDDLAGHDIIAGSPREGTGWRFGPDGRPYPIAARLVVSTVDAQLAAAEAGLGIANLLGYQAAGAIAAGRLQALLDTYAPPPVPIHLLFDPGRARLPSLRLFVAAMKAAGRSLEGKRGGQA